MDQLSVDSLPGVDIMRMRDLQFTGALILRLREGMLQVLLQIKMELCAMQISPILLSNPGDQIMLIL